MNPNDAMQPDHTAEPMPAEATIPPAVESAIGHVLAGMEVLGRMMEHMTAVLPQLGDRDMSVSLANLSAAVANARSALSPND